MPQQIEYTDRTQRPRSLPTELTRVAEVVRNECCCDPGVPVLVDADPACPVWKVEIGALTAKWGVPPPPFVYVCTVGEPTAYRPDSFVPAPWAKEQPQHEQLELIKNCHIGKQRWRSGVQGVQAYT